MSFREAIDEWAKSLQTVYAAVEASRAQPEDQLKPPTVQLMKRLGELIGQSIVATTEAHMADLGVKPDVAVQLDGSVSGHIELKAPGKGANPSKFKDKHDSGQWKKFKNHPNLIYTDGNQWALYRTGERQGKIVRLTGDVTADGKTALSDQNCLNLEALLRAFASWTPIVPTTPRRLAETLAPLCRLLRDDAFAALATEGSAMHMLADEWRQFLFADADDRQFADAYAQTVTYALLLARVEGAASLEASTAAKRLDQRHGLLAQVLRILEQEEARKEVQVPIDLLERTIGAIDPSMMTGSAQTDPWLYFYEDFLAAYDRRLRNDRGVYYTPAQVVQAQVRLVTELLNEEFGKELGIVDSDVVLLDPAAGTGTYLLAAIDEGIAGAAARFGPGDNAGRASTAARNFHGFEILVGPYAVAHLRVAQRILDYGGALPADGVRVYLADTLESPFAPGKGRQTSLTHKKLSEESERARRIKAEQRVLVCIGNPPYDRQQIDPGDDATERKGGWVRFGDDGDDPILNDFTDPVREAGAGGQLKNLYNDYVYFWRWAMWKVFEQSGGGGIVSFITASSYLRGPAFAGMRKAMRETFDEMWVIDLGGDNLGARRSENVFAIQTPVAIAFGVRFGAPQPDQPAKIWYSGELVAGPTQEKLARLAHIDSRADLAWEEAFIGWDEPLLPERAGKYYSWPRLTDLFPWQHSGAQFKRTWPIAPHRQELDKRWKQLMLLNGKDRAAAFRETRDRKIDRSYADLLDPRTRQEPLISESPDAPCPTPLPYGYRSFDRQQVIADSRLADFPRPALWSVRGPRQVFITSLLTGLLGEGLAATASAEIPDLHHFRGSFGAKDVIPLWRDAEATEANVTAGLLETIGGKLGCDIEAESLLAYIYTVLAGNYTRRFSAELEVPGPRIPITKDSTLFARAVQLGRRLVWLHTFGDRLVPDGEKANTIPAGKAKCTVAVPTAAADYPDTFEYDRESKRLLVGSGVFEPVEPAVWHFSISGLQVVRSWLAYRMKGGAGRRSSPLDEIRQTTWPAEFTEELCKLLWILEQTVELTGECEELLDEIVNGPVFEDSDLPKPTDEEREPPERDKEGPEQLELDSE